MNREQQTQTAPTMIYGAGLMGRAILAKCRADGVAPRCFIDAKARAINQVDGIPVLTLEDAAQAHALADNDAVISVHSHTFPTAEIVSRLHASNFRTVRTFWQYCDDEAWLPEIPYWLAPRFPWDSHADDIAAARALLGEPVSRKIFDEQLGLRREGSYEGLRSPDPRVQYVPEDLPRWASPMSVIDCGAFDGDTLRLWMNSGYELADFLAFEPDEKNFARLERWAGELGRGRCLKAGAYSRNGALSFTGGTGAAAHLDPHGSSSIAVMRIDDVCEDLKPNLVKMDIEGAEGEALAGAAATIARWRPGLAISIYHRPEDLWAIALQIENWDLDYRFHIRSHAHNGFDTVLYALP